MHSSERYEMREFLGAGGMAQVYRARDRLLERDVALKILRTTEDRVLARAQREARSLARVEHRAVCKVFDTGEYEGKPFVAMELVDGPSLHEQMEHLDLRQRVAILCEVAEGVQAAHDAGLVHRDLKPGNVLLRRRDPAAGGDTNTGGWQPQIVDFGLARSLEDENTDSESAQITRPMDPVYGTPAYMAPEQTRMQSRDLDGRTDVWALGVMLFEMVSGTLPFEGETDLDLLLHSSREEAPDLSRVAEWCPRELALIAARCLQRERDDRYASARDLARDLRNWLEHRPISVRPLSRFRRSMLWARRHRTAVVAAAVVGSVAMALLVFWWLQRHRAAEQRQLALRFGTEAAQLSSRMRIARMAPVHDIGAERERISRDIDGLRQRVERMGPLAQAPGDYAIGVALLGLYRHLEAQQALQHAWDAGLQTPEVALALAEAMIRRYAEEIVTATQLRGDLREQRVSELEQALLVPAREVLASTPSSPTRNPIRDVLQEFVAPGEGPQRNVDIDEALAADPSRFELHELRAGWLLRRSRLAEQAGEAETALDLMKAARDEYLAAGEIARSHAEAFVAACRVSEGLLDLRLRTGETPEFALPTECETASLLDPNGAAPRVARGFFFQRAALSRFRRSLPFDEPLRLARAEFEQALNSSPSASELQRVHKGLANQHLMEHDLTSWHDSGRDVPLVAAVEHAREAARLASSPLDAVVLGEVLFRAAMARGEAGDDVEPLVVEARAVLDEAIEQAPEVVTATSTRAYLLDWHAQHRLEHGLAGAPELWQQARRDFERAARLDPQNATIALNHGISYLIEAEEQWFRGADPEATVAAGDAQFRRGLALSPQRAILHFNRGVLWQYAVRDAMRRGEEAGPAILAMTEAHRAAFEVDPIEYGCGYATAVWLRLASGVESSGEAIGSFLDGWRAIDAVLQRYPDSWRCLRDRARLRMVLVEDSDLAAAVAGLPDFSSSDLDDVLEDARQAKEFSAAREETLWLEAEVLRAMALRETRAEVRSSLARRALASYAEQAKSRPGRWNWNQRQGEVLALLN